MKNFQFVGYILPEYRKCQKMYLNFIKVSSYIISKIQNIFPAKHHSYQFSGSGFLAQKVIVYNSKQSTYLHNSMFPSFDLSVFTIEDDSAIINEDRKEF